MGKSSLAIALLHDESLAAAFGDHRYFISCESAESAAGLVSELAAHLGIAGRQLRQRVLTALAKVKVLLVLDNFETPWGDLAARVEVEDVLSALAALDSVTLVLTMRGTERPSCVQWSTPVLPPLKPIGRDASLQLFVAVSNINVEDSLDDARTLLDLLDDLPLAVNLVARLAIAETPHELLHRWNTEGTSMMRLGEVDRQSCLDTSISLSINSPRLKSVPQALDLLRLLSVLPNGLPPDMQHPHFTAIGKCASALKSSALAYSGEGDRLRVLSPIRAYILKHHPPSVDLIAPMEGHYLGVAQLSLKVTSLDNQAIMKQLIAEAANVESICSYVLEHMPGVDWPISVIYQFDNFLYYAGMSSAALLARAFAKAQRPEQKLPVLMRRIVRARNYSDGEKMALEALELARSSNDRAHEAEALWRLGIARAGRPGAMDLIRQGLQIFESLGEQYAFRQGGCLYHLASQALQLDDYEASIAYSEEAIRRFEACDSFSDSMHARTVQVYSRLRLGQFAKAEELANISAQQARLVDDTGVLVSSMVCRADIAVARGDINDALEFHEAAMALYKRRSDERNYSYTKLNIATLLTTRGELLAARRMLQEGTVGVRDAGTWSEMMVHCVGARVALAEGDLDQATASAHTAIALARQRQAGRMEAFMQQILGDIALEREPGDILSATTSYILSLVLLGKIRNVLYLLPAIARLGRLLAINGDVGTARGVFRWALVWSNKLGMKTVRAECMVGLARLLDASSPSLQRAWEDAGRAAVAACEKRLGVECETRLAALHGKE